MKIMIDIPKEFESDFSVNRFSDCFNRCLWDFKEYSHLVGNYERETLEMLMEAFKNSTPLPKSHGRLIDVNDLLEDICLEDNDYNRGCNMGKIITLEDIDRIQTIIEANKGD